MRRLIVFARLPVAGRVKTRLAATIGEAAALRVHEALLEATVSLAGRARADRLELRYDTPAGPVPASARALPERLALAGWRVAPQVGDDLGARMAQALGAALDEGDRPVLVGCDCPVLEPADLDAAFEALASHDAVFAPAEDGGYALVGLSRRLPAAFEGIAWGGAEVMARTRQRLAACGARHFELRTVWDVDVEADLRRWERAG